MPVRGIRVNIGYPGKVLGTQLFARVSQRLGESLSEALWDNLGFTIWDLTRNKLKNRLRRICEHG